MTGGFVSFREARAGAGHREAGLTLVEVLVAVALLSLLMGALGAYLLSIPRVNVQTTAQQKITLGAKRYFEEVRTTLQADIDAALPTPAMPEDVTCAAPTAEIILKDDKNKTAIRRVNLSCTMGGKTYTFGQDYGRRL